MKALSLWQPWASLMAIGAKRIETRSWTTRHRGPLAIHASKRFAPEERSLCMEEPFSSALHSAGFHTLRDLPLGAMVGVVDLIEIRPTEGQLLASENQWPAYPEISFGNYGVGRYAWIVSNILRLDPPLPWKGRQGLFNVPHEEIQRRCSFQKTSTQVPLFEAADLMNKARKR